MRDLRKCRLGLEAEVAAAEELNRLMQHGYTVFHDVPGDGPYNVDHVLVGAAGVFAIETKGRMKPTGPQASDGHIVESDGAKLDFPSWVESKPLKQAERNARWLSKWLSSAIGESVFVHPVLVLPGWFVKRTTATGVPVFNASELPKYLDQRRDQSLSERQIGQICHQLDTRCRTEVSKLQGRRRSAY